MSASSFDWLIFDGECNFCRKSVHWLKRRDKKGQFKPTPYQQAPSPPMTPELYARCEKAVHVVTQSGQVLRGGKAVLYGLESVGYRFFAQLLRLPPFLWLVEGLYRLVASNRDFFARFVLRREPEWRDEP